MIVHRLPPLPALPRPPARPAFPVIAVIAPLVGALVIGLITRSPFVLVFAVLSPLIAIATVLDGRRIGRRDRRAEAARFDRECLAFEAAITQGHTLEREHADARHPVVGPAAFADDRSLVRLGVAPTPSALAPDDVLLTGDTVDEVRLTGLIDRARVHPSLPVLVPRGPIAVRGDGAAAQCLARWLELEPGVMVSRLGVGEHADSGAVVIEVHSPTRLTVVDAGGRSQSATPQFVSRRQADASRTGRERGVPASPPTSVRWQALQNSVLALGLVDDAGGVPIGVDGSGPVRLDLERQGPHALVGGTTGSGKSEFLRALALGWAADRSPSELQLLFVDFKGGATFAGLTELPHAVGLVTDLDPLVAERALLSLRAELRRRERLLVDAGVRDLAQRPALLARLVVLVDEFAALIDAFPELHAPFADLSARGRSLGVHLVLCTQNPAGAVRDAVAGNCAVRIAFRLTASAGAGFVGAIGRELGAAPPGRALIVTADEACEVQIATIDDADIAVVQRRWATATPGGSPWLPPLPAVIEPHELADVAIDDRSPAESGKALGTSPDETRDGLVFGVLDDPAEQRRLLARWNPLRDGALAVVGAPRSGRSTALAALAIAAEQAGLPTVVLPPGLAEAWALLEQLAEHAVEGVLLIADDLDLLVAEADELAPELLSRWDSAVRAQRRVGGCAAAAVGAASAARAVLGARFASRLLLRCVDAEDHQLAGAPRGLFDRRAPAGRGWWADRQVQVVAASTPVLRPTRCVATPWQPPDERDVVVVTRRPTAVLAALHAANPDRVLVRDVVAEPPVPSAPAGAIELAPRIFVADPDAWQAAWPLFSSLRRSSSVVFAHAEPADPRALLGHRGTPPPLDDTQGDVWVSEPGELLARRRWVGLSPGRSPE